MKQIGLASTWHPRGELPRILAALHVIREQYSSIAIALPPETPHDVAVTLRDVTRGQIVTCDDWACGRHIAIQGALTSEADVIHYVDMDRLLHWIESYSDEWRRTVRRVSEAEFLIIGRTPRAFATHPKALQVTESIVNAVFSHVLKQTVDLGAGSRGLSRSVAERIMRESKPGRALATDAEWPVIVQNAGSQIGQILVEGLEWETPDHFSDQPAGAEARKFIADAYDTVAENWAYRSRVAAETVEAGLAALRQSPAA